MAVAKKKKKGIPKIWLYAALAVFLVGGTGSYFAAKAYLAHRVAGWKRDGLAAAAAAPPDYPRAVDLLGRYLNRNPEDIDTLIIYANVRPHVEAKNGQHLAETISALRLIVQRRPKLLAQRLTLLQMYTNLQRRPEAIQIADTLLDKAKEQHDEPMRLKAFELKHQNLIAMGSDREAFDNARAWASESPRELKPNLAKFQMKMRLRIEPQQILAEAQDDLKQHPDDPRFQLLVGLAYSNARNDKDAETQIDLAASHANLPQDVFDELADDIYDSIGQSHKAIELIEKRLAEQTDPRERVLLQYKLARRYWDNQQFDLAATALAALDPADPAADPTLIAFKAEAMAVTGKKSESDAARKALAARSDFKSRAWTGIVKQEIDKTAGLDHQIADDCRSALLNDPQNVYLNYYLGRCFAQIGELDQAINALERATSLDASWTAPPILLVECLLKSRRTDQAFEVAQLAMRRGRVGENSYNSAAALALARAWAAGVENGSVGRANELLDMLAQMNKDGGVDQVLLVQTEILAQQGQKNKAIDSIQAALARKPIPNQQALLGLAAISKTFDLGLDERCIDLCRVTYGINADLAYMQSIDHLTGDNAKETIGLYDKMLAEARSSTSAQTPPDAKPFDEKIWQFRRAQLLDATLLPEARESWMKLRDAFPGDSDIQMAVIKARAIQGDKQILLPALANLKALRAEPSYDADLATARLLVNTANTEADLNAASVTINDLISHYPEMAEPHVLLARALVRLKRNDGAVEQLSTAARLDPSSVPIAIQLAALLQSRGEFDRVQNELDRITPQLRNQQQIDQAATILAQQGDTDEALKLLQHPITTINGDTRPASTNDILLARLYYQQGDYDRAEPIIQDALKNPTLLDIQFAAMLYASEGKLDQARKTLELLDTIQLAPGVKESVLGDFTARTGDYQGAIEHFKTATTQAPNLTGTWRALAVIQLATGQTDAAFSTVEDAFRANPADESFKMLHDNASALKAGCQPRTSDIVMGIFRDSTVSAQNLDLLGVVSNRISKNDPQALASQLDQFIDKNPGSLAARAQLIQCDLSMGRRDEALNVALRAMAKFPQDPQAARLAIQTAQAAGRWADLESAAQTLKTRWPLEKQSADTAIARSRIARVQYSAAAKLLQPYAADIAADPDKNADMLALYCIALSNGTLDQQKAASDLLWPLASQKEAWRKVWISIAADIQTPSLAEQWLDRIKPVIPQAELTNRVLLAEAYDHIGRDALGQIKIKQFIQTSSEVFADIAAFPSVDAVSLLHAASQAEQAGDFETAKTLYRRVLEKDPDNFLASNNLAMLIVNHGGDNAEALALAKNALQKQPQVATLYDTLAAVQKSGKDLNSAIKSESAAVRLEPDTGKWQVRLAQYYFDASQYPRASDAIHDIDARGLNRSLLPLDQAQLSKLRDSLDTMGKRPAPGASRG